MNPCPKVITGPLHLENKTASDWGYQGFVAYGCYGYAVVIDPVTLQVVQTLGPHSGYVTHVRWSGENYHHAFATGSTYNLYLATADGTGNVIIWDVVSGQRRAELCDTQPSKPVLGLEWYTGNDESHDLLMVLRNPDCLELWDSFSGVRLWKKHLGEQLITFALDPFDIQRIVLLCESPYLMVLNDINVTREPTDGYRCVRVLDPQPTVSASGSQRKYSTGSLTRNSSSSLTKMASLATNMLTGPEQMKKSSRQSSINEDDQDLLTSCKQVVFNPAHRHIVLCVFATEIHVIDLDVDLTVSTMRLDRSSPNFAKVIPCRNTDMLFCLHENGSVSVRVRKQSNNSEKFQIKDVTMDMTYDLVCQSDPLRLLRHSKVFSMVYQPISEKQIALILSDSRVIFLDVLSTEYSKPEDGNLSDNRPRSSLSDMIGSSVIVPPGGRKNYLQGEITLRLVMSGLISGIISPVVAIETAPAVGDPKAVGSLVAVGMYIQVVQGTCI
ncbi:WD repeat-containing protein 11-like [Ruditapes philippinarum]|uniref:WD repeat-containing protein 11-like n=1 Tax=Ruditapes philippinarum TaxID=129788 RepID=UPI00295AB027|nr:WD repeat-containing protein 11-like [Ruditapes philippinarum]